jgi:hypothetical protein
MKTILFSFVLLTISACTIQPDSYKIGLPDFLHVEKETPKSNGKFCPPGQAKKGNC